MSLGSVLSIARGALLAHQNAVQVSSHNLSNAATEGYSRQRAALSPVEATRINGVFLGSGVALNDVERVRDRLLDTAVRRESGNASGEAMRRDLLGEVEGVFGDLADSPVSTALDGFWDAWSDLADHPSTGSVRVLVKQHGERVATTFNNAMDSLEQVSAGARDRVAVKVDEVNGITAQLAKLNGQIQSAELGGATAGDLRDTRDRLLDELSKRVETRTLPRQDGSIAVVVGGVTVVDGVDSRALEARSVGGGIEIGVRGRPGALGDVGGEIGAAVTMVNVDVPATLDEVKRLAAAVAAEVNTPHKAGTGRAFFAVDSTGRLSLSADISDPATIGVVSATGAGDNRVALWIAGLRDREVASLGGRSISDVHAEIVSSVGQKVRAAETDTEVYETLASQADARRSAVSGVSTDEEMIQLMRHQQAYEAAARMVNTVDEMIKTVLDLV